MISLASFAFAFGALYAVRQLKGIEMKKKQTKSSAKKTTTNASRKPQQKRGRDDAVKVATSADAAVAGGAPIVRK